MEQIEIVFQKLEESGLTVKMSKCTFAEKECTYLGHRIGQGGVKPEESKVIAIRNMARPTTKKEVRSFLGMAGYYRRFIQNYTEEAEPLTGKEFQTKCHGTIEKTLPLTN